MITIIDVIENFFKYQTDKNLLTIPGKLLFDFGEEVRRFAADFNLPQVKENLHPIYIGGWPSANFWDINQSRYIYSSLLYSGQILVKDPISDWFCNEQYQIKAFLSSRQGFINTQTRKFNTSGTRQFLAIVIPQLLTLKPLIQNGIIIPIPSKIFQKTNSNAVNTICNDLSGKIDKRIINKIVQNFVPKDLTVDDNRKGIFIFTSEPKEKQIIKYIEDTLYYFINEYMLSSVNGFYYTAPYDYENYIMLENFVEQPINSLPGTNIINALLHSQLFIHSGLTPEKLCQIRDDDNFNKLRESIYEIYNNVPNTLKSEELLKYLNELETIKIKPLLDEISKSSTSGILSKIGIGITKSTMRIGAAVLTGLHLSPTTDIKLLSATAGIIELINTITNLNKNNTAKILWKKIFAPNETANNHFIHYRYTKQKNSINEWAINKNMKPTEFALSSGSIIWERLKDFDLSKLPQDFPVDDVYKQCNCGSGLKFKFCCKGLEKYNF
jgi:hypothetical protein